MQNLKSSQFWKQTTPGTIWKSFQYVSWRFKLSNWIIWQYLDNQCITVRQRTTRYHLCTLVSYSCALFLHISLLPLFSCCTFWRSASCYTFFVLHLFRVALLPNCTFSYCTLFKLHFFVLYSFTLFTVQLFVCCTLFILQLSSCYTIFMLHFISFGLSLLTPFLFYSFHGALFRRCFSSHCALFIINSFMLHSFHVAAFNSSTLLVLYSFHNALSHRNRPCFTYIMLRSFKDSLFHTAIFSCCTLSFLLHCFHVELYQIVQSSCYIFWEHLQPLFLSWALNKRVRRT